MTFLRLLTLVASLFGAIWQVQAQENWTVLSQTPVTIIDPITGAPIVASSPTVHDLWGICYAGGQFVAVGTGGTIITSPNGLVWTLRNSGFPTRWLLGVGYGNGLYVAVGEGGLILTSPDAIAWTARNTVGNQLNAVAYGDGMFMAVDHQARVRTSADGITWPPPGASVDPYLRGLLYHAPYFVAVGENRIRFGPTFLGPTRILPDGGTLEAIAFGRDTYVAAGNGVAYTSPDAEIWTRQIATPGAAGRGMVFFNNQFVAVGDGGAISTSFDATAWTNRGSGTSQTLYAIAASPTQAIAVGGGGVILRSLPAQQAPAIVVPPAAVTEAIGGSVAFTVIASGTTPFSYQWRKNGAPLAGQSGEMLHLSEIVSDHAGNYSVTVTNAFGSATSAEVRFDVIAEFPDELLDPTFASPLSLTKPPRVIATQPDGKILIGGDFTVLNSGLTQFALARLEANGAIDPTFRPPAIDPEGHVGVLTLQPDGKILIGGNFSTTGTTVRRHLARLNQTGSLDPTFVSAVDFSTSPPTSALATGDGKILVTNNRALLTRLNGDGTEDATFTKTEVTVSINLNTDPRRPANFQAFPVNWQLADLQADGKILVSGWYESPRSRGSELRRFHPNGTLDSTFRNASSGGKSSRALRVLADGRVLFVTATDDTKSSFSVQRFTHSGESDPTYQVSFGPVLHSASIGADGRVWLSGEWNLYENEMTSFPSAGGPRFNRINADGTLDYNFGGTFSMGGPFIYPGAASIIMALSDGRALFAGNFSHLNEKASASFVRLNDRSHRRNPPKVLSVTPRFVSVRAGEPFSLSVIATGSGPLRVDTNFPERTLGSLFGFGNGGLDFPNPQSTSTYSVRVGSLQQHVAVPVYVKVAASAPVIARPPVSVQSSTGARTTLAVSSFGTDPRTYQWFKGGQAIVGPDGRQPTLVLPSTTVADRGDYTIVITNRLGSISQTVHVGVDEISRLGAISTRAFVGPGEQAAIAGFVIAGNAYKRVLVRGIGPGLTARFGLGGTLADPKITLFDAKGTAINTNDDWGNGGPSAADMDAAGLFKLDAGSKDAARFMFLPPGNYTVHLSSATPADSGIGLIEIYETDKSSERLTAISTRAFVGNGDGLAIPGISIAGPVPKKIIVRAIGPTLSSLGVNAPLADPILTLVNSITGEVIATNDDWSSSANKVEIVAASAAAGNFPLPDPSKDAVVVVTVPPGAYTALVRGANGGTGVALVEVYEVP